MKKILFLAILISNILFAQDSQTIKKQVKVFTDKTGFGIVVTDGSITGILSDKDTLIKTNPNQINQPVDFYDPSIIFSNKGQTASLTISSTGGVISKNLFTLKIFDEKAFVKQEINIPMKLTAFKTYIGKDDLRNKNFAIMDKELFVNEELQGIFQQENNIFYISNPNADLTKKYTTTSLSGYSIVLVETADAELLPYMETPQVKIPQEEFGGSCSKEDIASFDFFLQTKIKDWHSIAYELTTSNDDQYEEIRTTMEFAKKVNKIRAEKTSIASTCSDVLNMCRGKAGDGITVTTVEGYAALYAYNLEKEDCNSFFPEYPGYLGRKFNN